MGKRGRPRDLVAERRIADAVACGSKTYIGSVCKRGHSGERFITSKGCVECSRDKKVTGKYRNYEYYSGNREVRIEYSKLYKKKNKEKVLRYNRVAFAKRRAAIGSFTVRDVALIFDRQNGLCNGCSVSIAAGYHIDHKQPLSKGGTNFASNIQLLCQKCNLTKGAMDYEKWLARTWEQKIQSDFV